MKPRIRAKPPAPAPAPAPKAPKAAPRPAAPAASSGPAAPTPAASSGPSVQRVMGLPARPRLRVSYGWEGDKLTCEGLLMDERRETLRRSRFVIDEKDPTVAQIFTYFATRLVNDLRSEGVLITHHAAPAPAPASSSAEPTAEPAAAPGSPSSPSSSDEPPAELTAEDLSALGAERVPDAEQEEYRERLGTPDDDEAPATPRG